MMTQMITQALTILGLAGTLAGGTSDAPFVSGERALLNRVSAASPTSAGSQYGPIDPAGALLGRTAGASGYPAVRGGQTDVSPAPVGPVRALLGRGA